MSFNESQRRRNGDKFSWSILISCSLIMGLISGVKISSALLFVPVMSNFNLTRKETTVPFSIALAIKSFGGPLTALLAHKIGLRRVIILGSILSFIAVAGCGFAVNYTMLVVCYGVLLGFGGALATSLLPLIIHEHFAMHKTKAFAALTSTPTIASVIFSMLIPRLVSEFGLPSTFLLIAGCLLHSVPASFIILFKDDRTRKGKHNTNLSKTAKNQTVGYVNDIVLKENSGSIKKSSKVVSGAVDIDSQYPELKECRNESSIHSMRVQLHSTNKLTTADNDVGVTEVPCSFRDIQLCEQSLASFQKVERCNVHLNRSFTEILELEAMTRECKDHENLKNAGNCTHCCENSKVNAADENINLSPIALQNCEDCKTENKCFLGKDSGGEVGTFITQKIKVAYERNMKLNHVKDAQHVSSLAVERAELHEYKERLSVIPNYQNIKCKQFSMELFDLQSNSKDLKSPQKLSKPLIGDWSKFEIVRLLCSPSYIIILLCNAFGHFTTSTNATIIVDFAMDIGIKVELSAYIFTWGVFWILIGRALLGHFIDRTYIESTTGAILSFFALGVAPILVSFCNSFISLMCITPIEIFNAYQIIMPTLVFNYVDEDLHVTALSAMECLIPFPLMAQPALIGYFRDELGSYSGVFYVTALSSFVAFVLSFILSKTAKLKSK